MEQNKDISNRVTKICSTDFFTKVKSNSKEERLGKESVNLTIKIILIFKNDKFDLIKMKTMFFESSH